MPRSCIHTATYTYMRYYARELLQLIIGMNEISTLCLSALYIFRRKRTSILRIRDRHHGNIGIFQHSCLKDEVKIAYDLNGKNFLAVEYYTVWFVCEYLLTVQGCFELIFIIVCS